MPYGILKADTLTYYTATGDVSVAISGIAISGSPLISGVSGIFTTSVSGATVTGNAGQFTTITGGTAQFTNITGVSGTFTSRISGATVTGTSGQFTTLTATTGVFTTSISGATISGDLGLFSTISGSQGFFSSSLSVPSGTASSPSISFNGDSNTGIYSSAADQVAISTNGTQRINIEADGDINIDNGGVFYDATNNRLAIGSTTPQYPLHTETAGTGTAAGDNTAVLVQSQASGRDCNIRFGDSVNASARIGYLSNNLYFYVNANERARIDSSGRLLVGTSSARGNFFGTTLSAVTQTEGTGGAAGRGALSVINNDVSNNPPYLLLGRSGAASLGSNAAVVSGSRLGTLTFQGADGTSFIEAATVAGEVDGTPGTNDMPGRLVFSTTADGASSPTERVRISQNGVVTVKNGAVAEIGTLADGATVTPDFAANCNFTLTISGSRTLANPTNITAGQTGSIFIIQGSGSNTLSWGSYWDFTGGTAPTLSTASGAVDRVDYVVRTSTSIHTVFTANYS